MIHVKPIPTSPQGCPTSHLPIGPPTPHTAQAICSQMRRWGSSVLSQVPRYFQAKQDKIISFLSLLAGAIAPSNLSVNFLATPTHPEMSSWLICEVSGFFPQDIHLIWLKFQSKMNTSYFATAYPTQQPGGNTFQTWSVLRIPVPLRASLNTYTCVVEHEASQTKLNASKILDISGKSQLGKNVKQVYHWVLVIKKYSCLGRRGLHCLEKRNTMFICFSSEERTTQHFTLPTALTFFQPPPPWCLLNPGESDVYRCLLIFLGLCSTETVACYQQLDQV